MLLQMVKNGMLWGGEEVEPKTSHDTKLLCW